jgi:hypothetical protein
MGSVARPGVAGVLAGAEGLVELPGELPGDPEHPLASMPESARTPAAITLLPSGPICWLILVSFG